MSVVLLDSYRKPLPVPSLHRSLPTDCSFVKSLPGGGQNCWVVTPSGNYPDDCKAGRMLAEEYLLYLRRSAFPLQWVVEDMRHHWRSGIEIGFLGTVTKAAALGSNIAGDMLAELIHGVRPDL